MKRTKIAVVGGVLAASCMATPVAWATGDGPACQHLPGWSWLKQALTSALAGSGGFDLNMWATLVDRDGIVCQVAFTGSEGELSGPEAG